MPAELALLPFVERLRHHAVSSAKATGMWQFMPATGRDFDLKQNIFRDDRRDVLASTAPRWTTWAGSTRCTSRWPPTTGARATQKAVARNQRLGLPTDYASLKMPDETRYYVPKLQAVKNIVFAPERYALSCRRGQPPLLPERQGRRDIDVALAAQLAGISLETFQQFNPQMNKPVILAAARRRSCCPTTRPAPSPRTWRGTTARWPAGRPGSCPRP
jgi:membrane-bound lytic murein transglycosylase D